MVIQSKIPWKQSSKFKSENRFSMNQVHSYTSTLSLFFLFLVTYREKTHKIKSTKK